MKWKPPEQKKQKPVPAERTDSTRRGYRVPAEGTDNKAHGTRRRDRKSETLPSTVPAEGTLYSLPRSGGEAALRKSVLHAERRWEYGFTEHFKGSEYYAPALAALTPEIKQAATEAELKNRGAGLAYVMKFLREELEGA